MKDLLFDLDGTLLPMSQDKFIKVYFSLLAKRFGRLGIDTDKLLKTIVKGIYVMTSNDGSKTNEEAFWELFEKSMEINREDVEDEFLDFYTNEFNEVIKATSPSEFSGEIIDTARKKGFRVYLATNPLFPRVATLNRIRWAGMNADDFLDITTYETSRFCKPNIEYFKEIISRNGIDPKDAMMIGNDVKEDLSIASIGVKTFLVTDCLENKDNLKITADYQGSLKDLRDFLIEL